MIEQHWYGPPPDEAPTLVFLHEGLGSAGQWRDFPQQLAEATGCGAFVYSRAGYGESDEAPLPRPIRYMHDEADVLADLVRSFDKPILVGHSDGASIALIYASQYRNVRAMILEAPHVFAEPVGLDSIFAMKVQYETSDLRERLEHHHKNVDAAFRGWNDVWLHPDFRRWNIEELLPKVDVPLLLIQGEDDEYGTWAQVDAIRKQVRGTVETMLVEDCGHAPHRDQQEKVLSRMAAFIGKVLSKSR
ncbi:MAG: alpha/beta hydrolase [Acidobacteria bacterium]|nr:alpha/beta hydrolase [Acidobacteriota bacterium]